MFDQLEAAEIRISVFFKERKRENTGGDFGSAPLRVYFRIEFDQSNHVEYGL